MEHALRFVHSLSVALWIGAVFFFASIGGPAIFRTLERRTAGEVVSAIFGSYYALGYVCGALALASALALWALSPGAGRMLDVLRVALVVVMIALWLYAGAVVRPEAHRLRLEMAARQGEDRTGHYEALARRFSTLHKRSVAANGGVFLLGIALVAVNAYNR